MEIHSLEITKFTLKINVLNNPTFLFSAQVEGSNEVVFSSGCTELAPVWPCEDLKLHLVTINKPIRLCLHETNFLSGSNESKRPLPVNLVEASLGTEISVRPGQTNQQTFESKVC